VFTIEVRNRFGVQFRTKVPEIEDLLQRYVERSKVNVDLIKLKGAPLHFWIKAAVWAALEEARGNRERAAKILQIGERTLYRYCKKFDFGSKEFRR